MMASFWPWKGDDNSPASFEKTLSGLSKKISKSSTRLGGLRQRNRRHSVLWTLYSGFAYLLYSIILVLVIGWKSWGAVEYSAIAGGPIVVYLVRLLLTTYYDYRISTIQAQLDDLLKQRDSTIKKLKTATKYDSTAELLKKYGGTPTPKQKPAGGLDPKVTSRQGDQNVLQRTSFVPPPTANIPGSSGPSAQLGSPQQQTAPQLQPQFSPPQSPLSPKQQSPGAEFAPNAFHSVPQYALASGDSHWYDRFMDVLLGEDETLPGKRMALICSKCRLVNGQASPGIKRLEDVGKWRCGGCGAMNGEENDVKKIVDNIRKQRRTEPMDIEEVKLAGDEFPGSDKPDEDDEESDVTVYTDDEMVHEEKKPQKSTKAIVGPTEPDTPRRRSSRPKDKGRKEC